MGKENNLLSRRELLQAGGILGAAAATWLLWPEGISDFKYVAENPMGFLSFGLESLSLYCQQILNEPQSRIIVGQIKSEITARRPDSLRSLLALAYTKALLAETIDPFRLAVRSLGALSFLSPDKSARFFPVFIPDGRPQNPGVDKSIHFFVALMLSYELARMAEGREKIQKARFTLSACAIKALVGQDNLDFIRRSLSSDTRRNFPFPPAPLDLRPREQSQFDLLFESSLAYEALTISAPGEANTSNSRLTTGNAFSWLQYRLEGKPEQIRQEIEDALKNCLPSILCGLGDPSVTGDLWANYLGFLYGLAAARTVSRFGYLPEIPPIPFDDYSLLFGPWQGKVNSNGWTEKPPHSYPRPAVQSFSIE